MRLETIPIIIGVVIGLSGLALIADAIIPDASPHRTDRRRRSRPERQRGGEALIGGGVLLVGVALIGSDTWRYNVLAMLTAMVLFVVGLLLNVKYLRGLLFGPTRGAERERRAADLEPPKKARSGKSLRIR